MQSFTHLSFPNTKLYVCCLGLLQGIAVFMDSCSFLLPRLGGAFDLRLAVSVPLPIVMGIFVLLWFQSRLT